MRPACAASTLIYAKIRQHAGYAPQRRHDGGLSACPATPGRHRDRGAGSPAGAHILPLSRQEKPAGMGIVHACTGISGDTIRKARRDGIVPLFHGPRMTGVTRAALSTPPPAAFRPVLPIGLFMRGPLPSGQLFLNPVFPAVACFPSPAGLRLAVLGTCGGFFPALLPWRASAAPW